VKGEEKVRFVRLCEQASIERDPEKLLKLVRQINDMVETKRRRLDPSETAEQMSESRNIQ
jgi:hypothetical protein